VTRHAGTPLYVSRRSARNFWQTYRIYPDRIELRFWLRTLVVPREDLTGLAVRYPPVFPGRDDPVFFRILKLDWADFFRHVALDKNSGVFRQYRFTPDDPAAFVAAGQALLGE
jgi:hypothetical protein